MCQLPPDSHPASRSQTLPDDTAGALPEPPPEEAALVPTRTIRVVGLLVTVVLTALRDFSLPSYLTSRYVTVLLPAFPLRSTTVRPLAIFEEFLRTVLYPTDSFLVTRLTSTFVYVTVEPSLTAAE